MSVERFLQTYRDGQTANKAPAGELPPVRTENSLERNQKILDAYLLSFDCENTFLGINTLFFTIHNFINQNFSNDPDTFESATKKLYEANHLAFDRVYSS